MEGRRRTTMDAALMGLRTLCLSGPEFDTQVLTASSSSSVDGESAAAGGGLAPCSRTNAVGCGGKEEAGRSEGG